MPISELQKQSIINHYLKDGFSISAISRKTKVSEPTITKILKAVNIAIRRNNYQKLQIDPNIVNELYNNNLSTYEIANRFKCSDETIRKLINTIRPAAERNKRSQPSIELIRKKSIELWQNSTYKAKVKKGTSTPQHKKRLSDAGKANYQCSLGNWISSAIGKSTISKRMKQLWQDPAYLRKQLQLMPLRLAKLSEASEKALIQLKSDPTKRANWIKKLREASSTQITTRGWVSSSQKQLYYILRNSKIDFFEEGPDTQIGPFYVTDCVIPKQQQMKRPLIIEVQGEYWHSLPNVILKDKQKATYIRKHTNYDLLELTELDLTSFDHIQNKLANYGIKLQSINCTVHDITIKQIPESEASLFYSIFHYTGSIRKGAQTIGAYYNNELIAAISYTHPLRIQTATRLNLKLTEVMEISRLARRTDVICKNLASYLISKSRALLPASIKCLVSFSDSTYGHTGGVYKASGFKNDGVIEADYHYASMLGKFHKKTIWDRSKRMKMSEEEYAIKHGLLRVYGEPKTRWVFRFGKIAK